MDLSQILERVDHLRAMADTLDLRWAHAILALYGSILSVYVMQLTSHEAEDHADSWLVRNATRIGLTVLSLGFLWSLAFSDARRWQPWPPDLIVFVAIDMLLTMRALAIWGRIHREGHHRGWTARHRN